MWLATPVKKTKIHCLFYFTINNIVLG